ncbi:MAG: excinuclease ABC subunit UvrC [Methanosarcinaceae archaeon]|nr:excinuclease ABC subunit UvrC [Methanosarcinaceae archaeon]MDD4748982.1 excinuclease ABC subunit UvrC [Methanosarcinaceae archaeon]
MIDLEILPHLPGCYLFKDKAGTILYVGKAKDLKKRVSSYFQKKEQAPKTERLIQASQKLDFIVTNTEVEALLLENTLIKKHWPKYNVSLKDSRRYAGIEFSGEKFPRLKLARKKSEGGNFFGPFVSAKERDYIFETVRKTFRLRTCKRLPKRACLRYHMGVCSGPCTGEIAEEEYAVQVQKAVSVLKGDTGKLIETLKTEMEAFAKKEQFEQALKLRDEIAALEYLREKQNVERQKKKDEDILNYFVEAETVYLTLFKVYRGTLEEKQDFVFEAGENFLEDFLVQYYSENEPPGELILPRTLDAGLSNFLSHVRGKKVKITVPRQGEKKELLDLVRKNIEIRFFGARKKLEALQTKLALPKLPNVIECFDISHLSGTAMVGSMVQFRGGRPDKHNYRRFKIKDVEGIDDCASLAEVVRRRYSRLHKAGHELPDLIILDGGKGQLSAGFQELRKLGLRVPLISLAKREEEIYVPGLKKPLPIKKDEKASLFVQEIRDEAHRFAITYSRLLRRKSVIK